MSPTSEIKIKNIDHLGIVAGLIDEIGIVEIINSKLGIDVREKISAGILVKAILMNGLGFVSRPLYLFSQFFEDKGIETLLGTGIKADYINDDKIGRVMDKLYKYGLNKIFMEIVLAAIKKFQIDLKYAHLDSTSFHLHGEYKNPQNQKKETEIIKSLPVNITKGYSRDHRSDLKQVVCDVIVNSEGLPLYTRAGDGNEADKAVFGKILVEFKKQINFDSIMVCDSALYSQENLQLIKELKWISRVPMTIKKAKELVQSVEIAEIDELKKKSRAALKLDGYTWKEEIVNYAGIKQTWLIVSSQKRKESDLRQLEKQIKRAKNQVEKLLKELNKERFNSPESARYKLKSINQKLKLFEIKEIQVSAEDKSTNTQTLYQIEGVIHQKLSEIEILRKSAGKFILATNLVDDNKLEPSEILSNYKNQQSCERGFRFLKDPLFFADSFFVESPKRVETMLCLMSLSLLVYSLGQRQVRNQLKAAQVGIKSQLGKLTDRPTLRWIFQVFEGIHILTLNGANQIVNLTEERNFILKNLPSSCQKYYLLS
ncbi:IS1634 family transposase [Microcoleus sp. S13_D1]|uniref:IS1634 family transposase n=2 Tax=unclassified Microcoleus TaxID=2642155 RepID=UPI002FCEA579